MTNELENLKKKIIYRASYRGTKEMDVLISSFVKSVIDNLSSKELLELEKFVNLSDEELIKLNKNFNYTDRQFSNKIYKNFYNFKPL